MRLPPLQLGKVSLRSVWNCDLEATNRQTNKQTESGENITSFTFGGGGKKGLNVVVWRFSVNLEEACGDAGSGQKKRKHQQNVT